MSVYVSPFASPFVDPYVDPVADPTNPTPPAAPCFETSYDGVDDKNTTTDASVTSGKKWTVCLEARLDSTTPSSSRFTGTDGGGGQVHLILPYRVGSSIYLYAHDGSGAGSAVWTSGWAVVDDLFVKYIFTITNAKRELFADIDDGNGMLTRASNATALSLESVVNTGFQLGTSKNSEYGKSIIRNFEMYDAEATSTSGYVYGDPTSIGLVSGNLIERSQNGSGSDGLLSWVTGGAPVTQACT